jgi:hypothetical protein
LNEAPNFKRSGAHFHNNIGLLQIMQTFQAVLEGKFNIPAAGLRRV